MNLLELLTYVFLAAFVVILVAVGPIAALIFFVVGYGLGALVLRERPQDADQPNTTEV